MIPNSVHFVFGLKEEREPLHFLHYLSIESCRRVLAPDQIFFHHRHLPWGPWWDTIAPHLTLVDVEAVPEVMAVDYSIGLVPSAYRYAHHADFIRLDALIEHGGIYADIDTLFLRPLPEEFFGAPFVIGREKAVRDDITGVIRPSLCNALLMAEPGSVFAQSWRDRMGGELNGTWSNHSGFLAAALAQEMPDAVRVEPEVSFFPFAADAAGIHQLLDEHVEVPPASFSVHLWAHLWWEKNRWDFSPVHAGWCDPRGLRAADTTIASIVRPYLDERDRGEADSRWAYLSLDEASGYGIAAERCMDALEQVGIELTWTPLIPSGDWGLGYAPARGCSFPPSVNLARQDPKGNVVVVHLVPEFFPLVRARRKEAMIVGHTVWETDRVPDHWIECLSVPDLLVVPSAFSARAILASGASTPVEVVPHVALDPDRRSREVGSEWRDLGDRFVFYTIAEWNERKSVHLTIEAYLQAFRSSDPVVLVVKTSVRDHRSLLAPGEGAIGPGTTARALALLMARHPDPPSVILVTKELSGKMIDSLHVRGDCFVSLCRSEGWGLGAFDAAALGNPVITTGHGGHLEFLEDSTSLVDFTLVPVEDPAGFPSYAPDQRWAEPDLDHAVALIRRAVVEGGAARDEAVARAENIRRRFSPEVVGNLFVEAVARHRPPDRP